MSDPDLPALVVDDAAVRFGPRELWAHLGLSVRAGEFVAVLGPNGSGKSTLLKAVLGLVPLAAGSVTVQGRPAHRGDPAVGYVPQQTGFDADLAARGRDLVALGLDGTRYGFPRRGARGRERIDAAIAEVGAADYANAPIGELSGGEQQRLRMAQALVADPRLVLCDEPLLSLDLSHQRAIVELLDRRVHAGGVACLFVTHEINPVLPVVDRVVYLVDGRWAIGTPGEVMTGETLSRLYGTEVRVIEAAGELIVAGAPDAHPRLPAEGHLH